MYQSQAGASHDGVRNDNDRFTYANLNSINVYIEEDDPYAFMASGKFILFYLMEQYAQKTAKNEPKAGWKFHVAIDDSDYENMAAGWNAVKNVLMGHRVVASKVVKQDARFIDDSRQYGKQITIYAYMQPHANWQIIINEITNALVEAGVRPAPFSPNEMPVKGSSYISYRNDSDRLGRPTDASKVVGYNPYDFEDPFAELQINNDRQPPRATRHELTHESGMVFARP